MTAHQIAPRRVDLEKPHRDKKYLAFIRQQPCLICNTRRKVEAAHTGNNGKGLGLKADDRDCVPLCAFHHTMGPKSYHTFGNEQDWADYYGLDLVSIRRRLRARYLRREAA